MSTIVDILLYHIFIPFFYFKWNAFVIRYHMLPSVKFTCPAPEVYLVLPRLCFAAMLMANSAYELQVFWLIQFIHTFALSVKTVVCFFRRSTTAFNLAGVNTAFVSQLYGRCCRVYDSSFSTIFSTTFLTTA